MKRTECPLESHRTKSNEINRQDRTMAVISRQLSAIWCYLKMQEFYNLFHDLDIWIDYIGQQLLSVISTNDRVKSLSRIWRMKERQVHWRVTMVVEWISWQKFISTMESLFDGGNQIIEPYLRDFYHPYEWIFEFIL